MDKKAEALRLADAIDDCGLIVNDELRDQVADELRRLHHNNEVLMNALWKACGDDEQVVNATIESQGEMR